MLDAVRAQFLSERISDAETSATIRDVYRLPKVSNPGSKYYVLDPHSAVSVTAARRSAEAMPGIHYIALSAAHPAKCSHIVEMALAEEKQFVFNEILPAQLSGLDHLPRRIIHVHKSDGLAGIGKVIMDGVKKELEKTSSYSNCKIDILPIYLCLPSAP